MKVTNPKGHPALVLLSFSGELTDKRCLHSGLSQRSTTYLLKRVLGMLKKEDKEPACCVISGTQYKIIGFLVLVFFSFFKKI